MKKVFLRKLIGLIVVQVFLLQSLCWAADLTVRKPDSKQMLSPALDINIAVFQSSFMNILNKFPVISQNLQDVTPQSDKAEKPAKDMLLIFGGPDGVLLPNSRYHNTSLADSPVKDSLLGLLRQKKQIVIVSRQRYEDEPQLNEKGMYSRFISDIPENLRQYITLYVSNGKYKIGFDKYGKENTGYEFNSDRDMKPWKVQILKTVIKEVIDQYWNEHCQSPEKLKMMYPAFVFRKPQIVEHKYDNKTYAITVMYLPSRQASVTNLAANQKDLRQGIFEEISARIEKENPGFLATTSIEEAGATSIDISQKMPGNNDCALEDYFSNQKLESKEVIFYGDLQYHGTMLETNRLQLERRASDNLGMVAGSLAKLLNNNPDLLSVRRSINLYKQKSEIYDQSLYAALLHLNNIKTTAQWNNYTIERRINELYRIYKDYNLAFTNQASWTVLYQNAFGFNPELKKALKQVEDSFAKAKTVEDFFTEVDKIYAKYEAKENSDFFRFYSSIDPRLAKNLYFLRMKVYKDNAKLIKDVYTAADYKQESVSRTLIGYFQDRYIYALKESGIAELNKPNPEVTYVGGGGVATTTFLRKLVEKGIKSVAGLVSSSDDGGSSWKIMLAIAKTFGFYFIPPGDAAGVMIFTGADDAKVFSLFEIETKKGLPEELSTAGKRITADNVLPVWKQRIIDVNRVFNGQTNAINLPSKPKDFISFASGLMTLGDLIDRELIATNIMQLEGMSTANLLVMGAAFDQGALQHGKLFDEKTMKLDNLDRLIGAKEQQTLAVSWDYQRSCLVATYENGDKIPFQTLITDRLHKEFLVDVDFQIRTGDKDYSEFKSDEEIRKATKAMDPVDYPKANPDVIKAIENTQGAIMMGNGSLFTSMLPNLLYSEISEAIIKRRKQGLPVVFIVKIKSDIETSKGLKIVDEQGNIYEKEVDIENAGKGTKFYLEISETMSLQKQLEIIRSVVEKAVKRNNKDAVKKLLGKDNLELKDIMSHIIMPDEAFSEMIANNPNSNRVEISDNKAAANKLLNSLNKGEAQVSKQVKGFQRISATDRAYVAEQKITVLAVSKQGITGIENQKPMYDNEKLYEMTKRLIAEQKKSKILCVCNYNYNRSPGMEMVFEHLIDENGLSRYVGVSSGAVKTENRNSWGGVNTALQGIFKEQFNGKPAKQIKAKLLTSYQVQEAEVIFVSDQEIKDLLLENFKSEINGKKIVVLDDLAKNMQIVGSERTKDNRNAARLFKIRQIIEEKIWSDLVKSLINIKNSWDFLDNTKLELKSLQNSLIKEKELIGIAI